MTRNQSKSNFIEHIRSDLSTTIDAILYIRIRKEGDKQSKTGSICL